MLKNSKSKSYIVLLLSMILVLAPVMTANSANVGNVTQVQDNELVVSTLNDAGSIDAIKVLSHMRVSGSGNATVQDQSKYKLSSIRNLYGSEKINQNGESIGVNFKLGSGDGYKDVYYLSELEKSEVSKVSMPVSVKVSYYLNDQKVEASKLAGKSGHLKILCELENLTGAKKVLEYKNKKGDAVKNESIVYTPYVVSLSGWEFDNKRFSNIQAPGIAQKSPEGVIVDVQGKTSVSWTVPLIPPAYPEKQFTVLEADGKNIDLPSYKIAVIPIVPTTAAVDSLGTVQDGFVGLYDAFNKIQNGIGNTSQNPSILNGLNKVKSGAADLSAGLGRMIEKLKPLRFGLSNPAFDSNSYDPAKGTDAKGNKPSIREAVGLGKAGLDTKVLPALESQNKMLSAVETKLGKPGTAAVQPTTDTSIYNDISYLQGLVKGTPAEEVITNTMAPKVVAVGSSVGGVKTIGGLLTTGIGTISDGLGRAYGGLGAIILGFGQYGADGKPVQLIVDGEPKTILTGLSVMKEGVDGKLLPGVTQLMGGSSKIADGTVLAKEKITEGLNKMGAAPAIVSVLEDNASQADSFLGKPDGAKGSVVYVYQTPEVSAAAAAMNYGFGAIILCLIVLFAIGRPKSPAQFTEAAKEM